MKARCFNPNKNTFKHYGGRGITVCKEWANDFCLFMEWALSNGYKKGLKLDRKNNDSNYSPSNCRFITQKEQLNNKRDNVLLTHKGVTKTIAEWSEYLEVSYNRLYYMVCKKKMTIQEAIDD